MDFMDGCCKGISYEIHPVGIPDMPPLYSIKSLNQMLRRVTVYNQLRIFRINHTNPVTLCNNVSEKLSKNSLIFHELLRGLDRLPQLIIDEEFRTANNKQHFWI